ncbi:MAG: thioredoxin domain-containing protein [Alphaproteobacteria bacterium]
MKKILFCLLLLVFGSSFAVAQCLLREEADASIGSPDAPVVVVEYSSLTCHHCAGFHTGTLKKLKEKYIDTGKLRIVFRHYPMDRDALTASLVITSLPQEKRFDLIQELFERQSEWLVNPNPSKKIAEIAGITEDQMKKLFDDKELQNSVLQQRLSAQNNFKVSATPTFFIKGIMFEGVPELDEFEKMIAGDAQPKPSA